MEICADKNSKSLQNRPTAENQDILHTESGGSENVSSDKNTGQNKTDIPEKNDNANIDSTKKRKRKHRNRSERQKERVRQYKKKKRKEKEECQLNKQIDDGNTNVNEASYAITAEAGTWYDMPQEWASEYSLSDVRIWSSDQVMLQRGYEGTNWSAEEWYAENVPYTTNVFIPNSEMWQQQQELSYLRSFANSFMPPSNITVSAETDASAVLTPAISTLRASAKSFIPRESNAASSLEQTETLSPFNNTLPATDTNSGPVSKLRASAEIFIPGSLKSADLLEKVQQVSAELFDPDTKPKRDPAPLRRASSEIFAHAEHTELQMAKSDSNLTYTVDKIEKALKVSTCTLVPTDDLVSFEEKSCEFTPHSKVLTDNTVVDDDKFGILAIYTESSLHCELTTIVLNSEEMKENFGYEYFSLSNL